MICFLRLKFCILDVYVDRILILWEIHAKKTGFPGVNEIDREGFVNDVLISMFFSSNLRVQSRHTICDEEFGGSLNAMVYADTPSKLPVVYVVEAEKYDMDHGRAQLYPQVKLLRTGYKEGNWNDPIFGVISTAELWTFVLYDGDEWVESKPCFIDSASDRNGVQKVVESLYRILMHQDRSCSSKI